MWAYTGVQALALRLKKYNRPDNIDTLTAILADVVYRTHLTHCRANGTRVHPDTTLVPGLLCKH